MGAAIDPWAKRLDGGDRALRDDPNALSFSMLHDADDDQKGIGTSAVGDPCGDPAYGTGIVALLFDRFRCETMVGMKKHKNIEGDGKIFCRLLTFGGEGGIILSNFWERR